MALLGKLPDDVVGARIGLNRQSVAAERRRRGIPPARPRRPPVEWTAEMLSLLGSDSDRAVAEMLGLNTASVVRKRQELKIPPFYPSHGKHRKFPWRPEDLALLGKVSDGDLARRLGLTRTSVTCKRQGLGIAPLCPRARVIEWTPAMLERLGKAADWQIAEELGVASATIHKKRHELGILATKEVRPIRQNAAAAEILRLPTHEIKRLEGIDRTTIARLRRDLGVEEPLFRPPFAIAGSGRKARGSAAVGERAVYAWRHRCRWQPEEIALLGTAPDSEVARQVGRSALAVLTKRLALGMRVGRRFWQPEEIALLGTAMDKQVAARLGRSTRAVLTKRLALGIPAFDQAHSRQVAPKSRRVYQKRIKARKA
ncbi:MAG: hypothetical protein ACJ76J_27475 [Thermoanaerobaculia bacterium]